MPRSKISFEDMNGFKIMRIHNHPIMSAGVWNDWYYDAAELKESFDSTDWSDGNNLNLFWDHEDTKAQNLIGKVEKPHFDKGTIFGDLLVSNEEAQKAILLGAKFGISPKILGKGNDGSVKNFLFRNWSLVTDPACKTTFLNNQKDVVDGVKLIPNQFYSYHGGDIMTEEHEIKETKEQLHEQADTAKLEFSKQELSDLMKTSISEALKAKDEDDMEKMKKKHMPAEMSEAKVEVTRDSKKTEAELEEEIMHKMYDKAEKLGLINSEYKDFVRQYQKDNPSATLSEVMSAWNTKAQEMAVEKLVEKKLNLLEKGEKMSVKGTPTPVSQTLGANEDVDLAMLQWLRDAFYKNDGSVGPHNFELSMIPKLNPLGYRTFNLAATTTSVSVVRGANSWTAYPLHPVQFLTKAMDAAKERMMFEQIVQQHVMPEGHKDMIIPFRKLYMARGDWETSSAEFAAGSELTWTDITTPEGKRFTPARENYGIAITNDAIRKHLLNLVQYARDELSYRYEDLVDTAIRNEFLGTSNASSAATLGAAEMSSTVNGVQTIFGGDATDASNNLDAGDTFTPELIAKARRLLMSDRGYYWTGNVHTLSAQAKNAWQPEPSQPFVLFIGPEQEEALLNDSKFTNAAEYGSNEIVLNGEIGKYIGVKVVSTTKVTGFIASDEILVQTSQVTEDVAGHICGLIKAGRAGAIAWGQKPEIKVFDWPNADQVRMKLSLDYDVASVYDDATVRIVVSDA